MVSMIKVPDPWMRTRNENGIKEEKERKGTGE